LADSDVQTITEDRGKMAPMVLGSIAFCAVGGWLISAQLGEAADYAGWLVLVFSGVVGLGWAAQLVSPAQVRLDRQGLAMRYFFGTYRRRWSDIARIEVVQIKSRRIVKLFGKPGVASNLALGGAWPMSLDELVSLLEDYLARFGRTDTA
jgi:hypothetical protein